MLRQQGKSTGEEYVAEVLRVAGNRAHLTPEASAVPITPNAIPATRPTKLSKIQSHRRRQGGEETAVVPPPASPVGTGTARLHGASSSILVIK